MEFSKTKMKEVIKEQTNKRVSDDAAKELDRVLQEYVKDVVPSAKARANMDGRKTVRAKDMKGALRDQ